MTIFSKSFKEKRIMFYDFPKDIINEILNYTDNKTFYSCLKASKIFNVYNHNEIYKVNYLKRKYISTHKTIENLSNSGDLEGIKFLYSKGMTFTSNAMDYASLRGHFDILKFLKSVGGKCTKVAMDWAAWKGRLEILKWLHENMPPSKGGECSDHAMNNAAEEGHLDIVIWLYKNKRIKCDIKSAYVIALKSNQTKIVEYLKLCILSERN